MKIGSYLFDEDEGLGSGTSTVSYLARDDRGKQAVAKRLLDQLSADQAVRDRFLAVSELSAKIRMRKHVAVVFSQKSSGEGIFLLREYVEGRPLSEALRDGTMGDPETVRQVVLGLCEGVRALATRGVVHGGIHPGNVIVQPDGRIKLTDFGIGCARLSGKVGPAYPLEALRYLSPEQWQGAECTSSADIYAIGLIIVALLNRGNKAFDAKDRESLEAQVRQGCAVDCPVLSAAVHPRPSRRYPDVDKFRRGLVEKYFSPRDEGKEGQGGSNGEEAEKKKRKEQERKAREEEATRKQEQEREKREEERKGARGGEATKQTTLGGRLGSIFDVKSGSELPLKSPSVLCKAPRDGRRQQRPFQLLNKGAERLEVVVSCVGRGISASPERLDISPGRACGVIVNLEPESDEFADVVFRWNEQEEERHFIVKMCRST
ncbi:MAG: serine/threonine-protein kinase [Planctomycetota bacterium]